jgi:carbonic anhydrase/acetyltransferase-like protein (isoleucine patch superfamily)
VLYGFDGKKPIIGQGVYVSEHALVIGDVSIGDNCYIGHGAIIRGDYGAISIGQGTAIEEGVIVHAPPDKRCDIGMRVTVGHGAVIHAARIEDFAVIGMGAIASLYCEIGAYAIVAEGAVVKMRQKIPASVVAGGNPAKVIRPVNEKDLEFWKRGKEIYINLAAKYLACGMEKL